MPDVRSFIAAYLLNALWQLPLLVLATAGSVRLLRGLRPRVLYRMWVACLGFTLVLPALSGRHRVPPNPQPAPEPYAAAIAATQQPKVSPASAFTKLRAASRLPAAQEKVSASQADSSSPLAAVRGATFARLHRDQLLSVFCLLYAASTLLALLRFARSLWRTHTLLACASDTQLSGDMLSAWNGCVARFRSRPIRVISSTQIASPATIHWPRAILLLPADWHGATPDEMRTAFAHELAHIERRDFLTNLLMEALSAPLFFHPALHWLRRQIRDARELVCDDVAAEACTGRSAYAHSLLHLAQKLCPAASPFPDETHALGVFEPGINTTNVLERRIMNLLAKRTESRTRRLISLSLAAGFVTSTVAFAAAMGAPALTAQARMVDGAPRGWGIYGSKPQAYRTGVDESGAAFVFSKVPEPGGFGTLMQYIHAQSYEGKRLRFRASVRSEAIRNWAGLWMRVDKDKDTVAFDNMQTRAIKGTTAWKTYDVVLDVPADSTSISFGVLLDGPGKVWMDHVSIEPVAKNTPVTNTMPGESEMPSTPVNLDFHQRSLVDTHKSTSDTLHTATVEPPLPLAPLSAHGPSAATEPLQAPMQEPAATVVTATPPYEAPPAVDLVSITPHAPGSQSTTVHISNDNLDAINMSFVDLLERAYGVSSDRISGVTPAQADRRYDIHAKIDAADTGSNGSGSDASKYMLRLLVEKHFHVQVHTDSKVMPVDGLVLAGGGMLLKVAEPGASQTAHSDNDHVDSKGVSMARLAKYMSNHYRRTLVDNTGLKGDYQLDFQWPKPNAAAPDVERQTILAALQQQLGLTLKPTETSVKTLTVDRLDLP